MTFAVVSMINPPWLQRISHPGTLVESRDYKDHGDNLMRNGDFAWSVAQYLRALEIKPDYGQAMCNLGLAYYYLNDVKQSEQWLLKSLNYPDTQRGLAQYYLSGTAMKAGKPDDAIAHCRSALDEGHDPRAVWRRLATAEVAAKRWENAIAAYESALASDRDITTQYRNMLYADLPRADADLHLTELTDSSLAHYDLGLLRALQKSDPDISKTTCDLGIMYFNLGDTLRAIELVEESLRIWPENTRAKDNLRALTAARPR